MNTVAKSKPMPATEPFENLSLRIRKSVKDNLIQIGMREDRSVNYIVNQVISDFIADYNKQYKNAR